MSSINILAEKRTCSTLTAMDQNKLFKANGVIYNGMIMFDGERIGKKVEILNSFWEQYAILKEFNETSVIFLSELDLLLVQTRM